MRLLHSAEMSQDFGVSAMPQVLPEVRVLRASELGNSSFLVADPDAGEAIAIDPLRDIEDQLAAAEELGVRIGRALDTHLHNDFVSGCRELAAAAGTALDPLLPGATLEVGRFQVKALLTPGHTPDHLSYLVSAEGRPLALFSGGALMVGSIARTDLFGPHLAIHLALEALTTLQVRLRELPDEIALYPTHGAGSFCGSGTNRAAFSTLGQERRTNPFLTTTELMPFLARALHQVRFPTYYRDMADLNRRGAPILGARLPLLSGLKPYQVDSLMRERRAAVVDLRPPRDYDREHIPGSYNIGAEGPVSAWVGWIIERGRPIVLAGAAKPELARAHRQLLRIGYDAVAGALEGGIEGWREAGLPISTFETAEIEDLASWVLSAEPMTVVDTRDEAEWVRGHVPGAVHLYVPDVEHHADELPREAPLAVHCASGYRAGIAASILEQAGFKRIIHVAGPWSDWDRLHLATDAPG
jgi:hydroxyacylglutathione hydrolase